MNINKIISETKSWSSEEKAACFPHDEKLGRYELLPVCTCERCGQMARLDDSSIPFEIDANPAVLKKLFKVQDVQIISVKPDYIGWSDEFGGAVCSSCDEELESAYA